MTCKSFDNFHVISSFFSGFLLLLNFSLNLPYKLETLFFLSKQTYKFRRGSNNYFPHSVFLSAFILIAKQNALILFQCLEFSTFQHRGGIRPSRGRWSHIQSMPGPTQKPEGAGGGGEDHTPQARNETWDLVWADHQLVGRELWACWAALDWIWCALKEVLWDWHFFFKGFPFTENMPGVNKSQ